MPARSKSGLPRDGRKERLEKLPSVKLHVYEIRPRKDRRGFDLLSDVLPFGRLWFQQPNHAADYARFFSRSGSAEIRMLNVWGDVLNVESWTGNFKEG